MTLRAILFDLDGTLIDTNELHVESWSKAFESHGYRVGRGRIADEIGKGGDLLVEAVLGRDVEEAEGDALREARDAAFEELAAEPIRFFPGARELLHRARRRGLETAIATSSSKRDLALVEKSLGDKLGDLVDVVTSSADVETSKPAPDILHAACARLGEDPLSCALVGDSLHDAFGARRAGVAFIGVTTGYATREAFARAGARFVAETPDDLGVRLGEAVAAASHLTKRLGPGELDALMEVALGSAREGLGRREAPTGAAVFNRSLELIGRGFNRACETGDRTLHAEIDALHSIARAGRSTDEAAVLVSTLEPCVMCLGAAMEIGIDVVVYGLEAPDDGGTERVEAPRSPENLLPRTRGGVRRDEARALFVEWMRSISTREQRPFAESLLDKTRGGPRREDQSLSVSPNTGPA
jgi:HAD superfamily hydrolase (TIGR01509 family)